MKDIFVMMQVIALIISVVGLPLALLEYIFYKNNKSKRSKKNEKKD